MFEAITDHFNISDEDFRQKMKDPVFKAEYAAKVKARNAAQEKEHQEKKDAAAEKVRADLDAAIAKREKADAELEKSIEDGSLRKETVDELMADGDTREAAMNKTSTRAKLINIASSLGII